MSLLDKFRVPVPGLADPDVFSICFERSGPSATAEDRRVDIVAQMNRAVQFVEAFKEEYFVEGIPLGLTIIGGGVAGVVAALAANQHGIGVKLFETKPVLFSRQAGCNKYIYPYLYNWPVPGWKTENFTRPSGLESVFFEWRNGQAMTIAAGWQQQFEYIRAHLPEWKRPHWNPADEPILDTNREKLSEMFHDLDLEKVPGQAILFALGFYQDRCWIDHDSHIGRKDKALHSSPDFWDNQINPTADSEAVVISGGGDGGLQDFITISTGETIHSLAFELLDEDLFPESLRNRWSEVFADESDPRDCPDFVNWVTEHLPTDDWEDYLRDKMRGRKPAHLIVRDEMLKNCFPLNAVLALMVEKATGEKRIHFSSEVVKRTLMDGRSTGLRTVAWRSLGHELPERSDCELIVRHGVVSYERLNGF
jgi:hypothetical protein